MQKPLQITKAAHWHKLSR